MKKCLFILLLCSISFLSFSQLVAPVNKGDGKYGFTCKNIYFEVDAKMGGRVRSLKIDNKDYIFSDWDANSLLSGSTFWPSPQSWGWPPSTELDSDPYTAEIAGNKLLLSGDKDPASGLYFDKIFSVNEADTSISLEYIINNANNTSETWAPWEVTRVPREGLTFFKKGDGNVTGDMKSSTSISNACVWYDQSEKPSGSKFFCDGKGWLAHVNPNKQFFIKVFEDIALEAAAPAEAEVEVYSTTSLNYTELENQGAYTEIEAGGSLSWTVKWYLRNLPENITVSSSSQALVEYADSYANRLPAAINIATKQLKVYPNPAVNTIMFPDDITISKSHLNIYNVQGSSVLSVTANSRSINVSKLNNGFYFFELRSANNEIYKGTFVVAGK